MRIACVIKKIQGAPNEFQLLPYGQIEIEGEEPAHVDEESIRSVMMNFARRGNDMVIDYEHQTLAGGEAPAAGWIKSLIDKGKDGIHVLVEWTERGKEYLKNKEYRYFSPVMWLEKGTRRVVRIENVALTNFPKLNNLKPIIAKMDRDDPIVRVDQADKTKKEEGKIMMEKLKKLLGLAADAAEDAVSGAVELLVAKVKTLEQRPEVIACKEVLDAVGAQADATKEQIVQIVASLRAPADAAVKLSQDVARLSKELSEIKQNDLIQLALKEGKTSPDELDKWGRDLAMKNPESFSLIVLSRPAGSVIPVGGLPSENKEKTDGVVMDEAIMTVAKLMGNTEADLKKYR